MLGGCTGLSTVFWPATAAGHGLSAEVFLSEPAARVEAHYSDASPASHATVKVYGERAGGPNPDGPLLLEARLDSEGKYAFVPQAAEDLYIVIDDTAGRRAEVYVLAKRLRPVFA